VRRANVAQRILAIATAPDRAAAVVGDLLEEESTGGRVSFWWTVARTTLGFAWLNVVRFISRRHYVFSGADNRGQVMDFWRFVCSRKWLLVVPVVLCATVATVVGYSQPLRYRSQTTIIVVPQRVPQSFVPSPVTSQFEERAQSITQQILSRTHLERIIAEFNLYEEERKTAIMGDIVQRMRDRDIQVATSKSRRDGGDVATFTVSFVGTNPRVTASVTDRLASLFIYENLQDRSRIAQNTSMFLEGQIEWLGTRVDELAAHMEHDRIERRPSLRSQVIEYEELQNAYRAQLAHREQARIAANLDARQIGEQFQVIEPARIAARPEGPERLNISLLGATIGLALGLLLMLASAMRPPAPPAAVIPAESTAAE